MKNLALNAKELKYDTLLQELGIDQNKSDPIFDFLENSLKNKSEETTKEAIGKLAECKSLVSKVSTLQEMSRKLLENFKKANEDVKVLNQKQIEMSDVIKKLEEERNSNAQVIHKSNEIISGINERISAFGQLSIGSQSKEEVENLQKAKDELEAQIEENNEKFSAEMENLRSLLATKHQEKESINEELIKLQSDYSALANKYGSLEKEHEQTKSNVNPEKLKQHIKYPKSLTV